MSMIAQAPPRPLCRIGTSGFHYDHWKGVFYPPGLPKSRWFERYAAAFDTLEINNSFYRVPDASTFECWRRQARPGFLYALKFSRFATHNKKLLDAEATLNYFFDRAAPLGREAMGPVLVQLPPRWRVNLARLEEFLKAAAVWSRRLGVRWAVEMREPSWLQEPVYDLLRAHNAALCIHDMIQGHPRVLTAGFTYWRFHGWGARYGGDYAREQLRRVAVQFRSYLKQAVDVFAYFNNDAHGYAVKNALELERMCPPVRPRAAPPGRAAAASPGKAPDAGAPRQVRRRGSRTCSPARSPRRSPPS
jgi:uncharacterized protein YecE (DUF72 family)